MIKLQRNIKPQILIEKEEFWKDELLEAISEYSGYSNIPQNKKDNLIKHYRHSQIKEELFKSSHSKCAFCESMPEEGGFIEVEQFHPKSLYPEETFEWRNLLPVCRRCNLNKSNFDTKNKRILNPYEDDPELYLDIEYLEIVPKENSINETIASNTIELLGLNDPRLIKPRSVLLVDLTHYMHTLKNKIQSYKDAIQSDKNKILIEISNSLDLIKFLALPNEKYSFYVKKFCEQKKEYIEAKELLEALNI